jgi:hypothetical protein
VLKAVDVLVPHFELKRVISASTINCKVMPISSCGVGHWKALSLMVVVDWLVDPRLMKGKALVP